MGQLLAYSLTSSILLACLYLVYKWALSSENYHKVNRIVLWTIYLSSLGLPLVWKTLPLIFASAPASQVVMIDIDPIPIVAVDVDESSPSDYWIFMAVCAYLVGMGVVVMLTAANFVKLYGIIRRGEKITVDGRKVILTDDDSVAPFSFCKTIVIPRVDFRQYGPMIMMHEKSHVEFCHWIDLLFAQAVCVLQWFNPAAWLMREELKTIHEYQADDRVISSGVNVKDYQMLLIKKAVGARFPSLANSLNHSKLKKRITMMYNQKTSRRRALRPLLLLPALGAAFWISQLPAVASALSTVSSAELPSAVSADKVSENPSDKQVTVTTLPSTSGRVMNVTTVSTGGAATASAVPTPSVATDEKAAATDSAEKAEVSTVVEQMPEFPGGSRALMEYVVANLQHPKGTENISGRVVLKFVVEKDGSIGDVQVIRSLDPRLDAEAIRVVKSFPKWTPGIKDGKSVAVWYAIPITFRAMGDDTKDAKAAGDGSSSTSVSTSVSTETDDSGKTSSSTYSSVHIKENGETIHFLLSPDGLPDNVAYYVNGERFDGNLKDIPASDIESMTIDKSNPGETAIRINLKNK